jgi:hypothetical protein
MKKIFLIVLPLIFFYSCTEDDFKEIIDSKITAKEKIAEVVSAARTGFAADAKLAAIYGREVDINGEIDLLNTNSINAFVYVVQSNTTLSNEFYVPVFGAGPVQSPINFTTMLSFINDTTAKSIVGSALGTLATVSIDESVNYSDSPATITTAMQNGGTLFMNQNADAKIDLLLLPSKSIDTTSVSNSADWIVNFHSSSGSLVLWINTQTGDVIKLSQ